MFKMIKIDQNAPNEIELKRESITKQRYLEFRDKRSTSSKYSFRIEGIRLETGEQLEKEYLNRLAWLPLRLKGLTYDIKSE